MGLAEGLDTILGVAESEIYATVTKLGSGSTTDVSPFPADGRSIWMSKSWAEKRSSNCSDLGGAGVADRPVLGVASGTPGGW